MVKGFLEELKNWQSGGNPADTIFFTVKKAIYDFTKRLQNLNNEANLRGFIDFESYNDYLEIKLWDNKLLAGGIEYIINASNDDEHAVKNLFFLISQMNDQIGLEVNPETDFLITIVKDHLADLFSEYFSLSNKIYSKSLVKLVNPLDYKTASDIIIKSKRHSKEYRIKIIYHTIELFTENDTISFSTIIKNLKESVGISDTSAISINPVNDNDETPFSIELAEKDTNQFSIINKELLKSKLDNFIDSLTTSEFTVFINWLDSKYEKENLVKDSFNKRLEKLTIELNIKKSAIYDIKVRVEKGFQKFLNKFEQEDRLYIISLIVNTIREETKNAGL